METTNTTLAKVISGGQTGADIGGVLAARLHGLKTGGWMPKGWKTLNGPRPEYADLFDMKEHALASYKPRTWQNVEESDGTVRFACNFESPGEICTANAINYFGKPVFDIHIIKDEPTIYFDDARDFVFWSREHDIKTLNVAGNSHKTWAGMQSYVVQFLSCVFLSMGFDRRTLCAKYSSLAGRGW